MLIWNKNLPTYLTERKYITSFVLFTALFALVFINIYAPFDSRNWLKVNEFEFFLYSSIVILIGILVIAISRILLHYKSIRKPIKYGEYSIWIASELLSISLVYALIQHFVFNVGGDFLNIVLKTFKLTSLVILMPYIMFWLYATLMEKYKEIEEITKYASFPFLKGRNSDKNNPIPFGMIPFHDEKGVLKFSVKREDLLYLEAADNYVIIFYSDHQKISKFMIRNTLKRIENQQNNIGLVRCHRSYIVNFEKIKIIKKDKEGLILEFDIPEMLSLPVSKTYINTVIRHFSELGIE
jgi:hypothetical protein